MNVFDEERGPLLPEEEAQKLLLLAEAGLTLEELRAWERAKGEAIN